MVDKETRRSLINLSMLVGALLSVGLLVYVSYSLQQDGGQCIINPLKYGAEKIGEANNADFYGQGYLDVPNSPIIRFDKNGVTVNKQETSSSEQEETNITLTLEGFESNPIK